MQEDTMQCGAGDVYSRREWASGEDRIYLGGSCLKFSLVEPLLPAVQCLQYGDMLYGLWHFINLQSAFSSYININLVFKLAGIRGSFDK